jgi:hypothetical protein
MSSSSNLWSSNATHRVFGWKELLEEWNSTLQQPPQVKRVQDNLQAATNPNGTHNPSLTQFLTYLNYEQEGIAWFLYECISIRWMYDTVPLNYIRSLVDEIEDLDARFPLFPGSPYTYTIREFVEANLDADELEEVQMLPPLVPQEEIQTPARPVRADYSYAQRAPFPPLRRTSRLSQAQTHARVPQVTRITRTLSQQFDDLYAASLAAPAPAAPKKLSIEVRFIRNKKGSDDDVVSITQVSDDSYNILYKDKQANVKSATTAVPRAAVVSFLRMTLRMLTVDEEPFESVQFTLPSMPTILVSPKNLTSQTRDLIYDSVEATMNYWPVYA